MLDKIFTKNFVTDCKSSEYYFSKQLPPPKARRYEGTWLLRHLTLLLADPNANFS